MSAGYDVAEPAALLAEQVAEMVANGDVQGAGEGYAAILSIEQSVAQAKRDAGEAIRKAVAKVETANKRSKKRLHVEGVGVFERPRDKRQWDAEAVKAALRDGAVNHETGEQLTEAEATLVAFSLGSPRSGTTGGPGLSTLGLDPDDYSTFERVPGIAFRPADSPAPKP